MTAERVAAVLERDPTAKFGWRWRPRPLSMFGGDERIHATWNRRFAGQPAGAQDKGRTRVVVTIDHQTHGLRRIEAELGDAIDAIASSSPGNPDDENSGGNAGVSGALAEVIHAAARRSKRRLIDFTVLSKKRDPYRLDTPQGRRLGQWFAGWLDRLFPESGAPVHLRGLHYALVSTGGVAKPDGAPYVNTESDSLWLEEAAKAARWLGYVDFERIVDQRNSAPVKRLSFNAEPPQPVVTISAGAVTGIADEMSRSRASAYSVASFSADASATAHASLSVEREASLASRPCEPRLSLDDLKPPVKPYTFAFFGEKSSLEPVLGQLAEHYGASLYLGAGELSDTLIYDMAKEASDDGRPMIVFTFSDFDPSGWQMPISIGRKLQALRDLQFPTLRAQVVPVSLTLEQVIENRLPTTPVKAEEGRREQWDDAFGPAMREAGLVSGDQPAQVEIDALAVLRPEVLRRTTHEAIAPYLDTTAHERVTVARQRWLRAAARAIAPQIAERQGRLDAIKQAAAEAVDVFNGARDRFGDAGAEARRIFEAMAAQAEQAFDDGAAEAKQAFEDAMAEVKEAFGARMGEAEAVFDEAVERPLEDLDEARDRLAEIDGRLDEVVAEIVLPDPPEPVEAEVAFDQHRPIVDLDWSFEDATMALKARKAYEDKDD